MAETANLFFLDIAESVGQSTVVVQVLAFIVLLALLKKFAWGPLKDVMGKRERDINRDIDDAEQAKLSIQRLEEENKQKLRETREEVQKILEDARVQVRQQQEQIVHEVNIRADGVIGTAQSEVNSQKERTIADINNRVSELSVLITSKVLRKEASEQGQKALADKYLREAGDK